MTFAGDSKDPRLSDDGKWWWTGTEYIPANEASVATTAARATVDAAPVLRPAVVRTQSPPLKDKSKGHKTEIKVKTYQGGAFTSAEKNYQRDASKMAHDGWLPQSQSVDRRRLTVTYLRTK